MIPDPSTILSLAIEMPTPSRYIHPKKKGKKKLCG